MTASNFHRIQNWKMSENLYHQGIHTSTLWFRVNPNVAVETAINNAEDINWILLGTWFMMKADITYPVVNAVWSKIDRV